MCQISFETLTQRVTSRAAPLTAKNLFVLCILFQHGFSINPLEEALNKLREAFKKKKVKKI